MREVVGWLSEDAAQTHLAVRAAMTHLNVVSMNPVRDGNGRISRIVQSLVLAIDVPRLPTRPHECRTRAMNKAPPRVLASRPFALNTAYSLSPTTSSSAIQSACPRMNSSSSNLVARCSVRSRRPLSAGCT